LTAAIIRFDLKLGFIANRIRSVFGDAIDYREREEKRVLMDKGRDTVAAQQT
jgi:hypothetical protein